MRFLRYDWAGAAVGIALPFVATLIAAWDRHGDLGLAALGAVQGSEPLLWLMDTAPFVAGTLGWALERQRRLVAEQQERIARLELQRRVAFERTAAELSGTALTLLADVSALGASTAQTNASVRGTIETMTALSQGATAVALAAETVAGRALDATARRDPSAEELAATLRSAASGAKEIARIAQEQMGGIDQVLAAMNEIHFATESTAASAREVAAEARALAKHARELRGGPGKSDDGLDAIEEIAPDAAVAPPPSANTEWVAAASDSAL
jgi:methyl-accepting chemotaxis protein